MRHALMFAALCMLAAPLAADFEADVEASVVAPGTAKRQWRRGTKVAASSRRPPREQAA